VELWGPIVCLFVCLFVFTTDMLVNFSTTRWRCNYFAAHTTKRYKSGGWCCRYISFLISSFWSQYRGNHQWWNLPRTCSFFGFGWFLFELFGFEFLLVFLYAKWSFWVLDLLVFAYTDLEPVEWIRHFELRQGTRHSDNSPFFQHQISNVYRLHSC